MSQNAKNPTPQTQKHELYKTAYGPKDKVALTFPENSRWTKQSFKEECDINNILSRYMETGEMPAINQRAPQYLDATQFDYQEAMNFISEAKSMFGELPAELRNRFQNDPGQFLDFCQDPKNRPEMAVLGLLRDPIAEPVPIHIPTGSKTAESLKNQPPGLPPEAVQDSAS